MHLQWKWVRGLWMFVWPYQYCIHRDGLWMYVYGLVFLHVACPHNLLHLVLIGSATECPVIDGAVCGEHGTGCDGCSGQCLCQDGWMQPTLTDGCICANTTGSCVDAMGVVCGGHGTCNSPQCGCNCEKGWKGPTCSECDPSVTISTVLNAGQYCNGVLVTTDGYTCQQSTCMSFCTAASSCSDCESLVNSGCGWCGATQTCSDAYTATLVCKDDPSRVNESCNGGNSVIVPAAAGAAAGAAVLLIAGLLGFKVCVCGHGSFRFLCFFWVSISNHIILNHGVIWDE